MSTSIFLFSEIHCFKNVCFLEMSRLADKSFVMSRDGILQSYCHRAYCMSQSSIIFECLGEFPAWATPLPANLPTASWLVLQCILQIVTPIRHSECFWLKTSQGMVFCLWHFEFYGFCIQLDSMVFSGVYVVYVCNICTPLLTETSAPSKFSLVRITISKFKLGSSSESRPPETLNQG